ncbi:HalOD1 output domain-containing protein [Natronolimnobius baerhuensis]|uniref:Halobacterial output domain-containing protein n=1 Tax=Natronolimnobius baerhuensis TaxID=253108 RepID=A0A202E7P6_9EURY|nr:HalOD1 output domain-containing protein [Natronolimnobius baerhuensis]OVE84158.1 hypothetical protein B2G88_06965 [Natronolimnobius baerhuensis]
MATQRPVTDGTESVVHRIIDGVAAVQDTQPPNLTRPLYESVDPDALKRLIGRSTDADLEIQFEYQDCLITVDGDESVTVSPLQNRENDE